MLRFLTQFMLFYEANKSKNRKGYLFCDSKIEMIAEHLLLEIGMCDMWPHDRNHENLTDCFALCLVTLCFVTLN